MALSQNLFSGESSGEVERSTDAPPPPTAAPVEETPADQPPPVAAQPELQHETPPPEDAWWASSAPAGAEAPPTSQSASVSHPAPDPGTPPLPVNPHEAETAPHSLVEIEQARAQLAAEQAEAAASPNDEDLPGEDEPLEGTRQLDEASAPAISSSRSQQGLAAAALRDIGRVRELNQDSVFALITTLPREGNDLTVGLFIVADGMGGHEGGEIASRLAVRTVVHHVLSQLVLPAFDDSLEMALQPMMIAAVQAANEAIWEQAQSRGSDMGTTCTAVLLLGQGIYIAHVGDSRAYLYEPGGLKLLTTDHSTVGRLIQLGQLDPSEAREHPLRNQLYRTVGQQPQIYVDFLYESVGTGSHLLLCSDGLWGMIDENLMQQAINRSPWPQDVCHELIALANLAGGEDNISAVVVSLPLAER